MNNEAIMLCSNIITAAAYFLLSVQLVGFVRSSQVLQTQLSMTKLFYLLISIKLH